MGCLRKQKYCSLIRLIGLKVLRIMNMHLCKTFWGKRCRIWTYMKSQHMLPRSKTILLWLSNWVEEYVGHWILTVCCLRVWTLKMKTTFITSATTQLPKKDQKKRQILIWHPNFCNLTNHFITISSKQYQIKLKTLQ